MVKNGSAPRPFNIPATIRTMSLECEQDSIRSGASQRRKLYKESVFNTQNNKAQHDAFLNSTRILVEIVLDMFQMVTRTSNRWK